MMVDVPLILSELRARGYDARHATPLSENAGDYEFEVDGEMLVLAQVQALIESEPRKHELLEGLEPVKAPIRTW
jgi:hypothetical protein